MNGDSTPSDVPLILFSAIGVDASVFLRQQLAFPNLIIPDWLTPNGGEYMTSYCARFAASLDPDRPCIVGGASFGGIVALEMTRHLNAMACILIGSARGPHQLPKRIRKNLAKVASQFSAPDVDVLSWSASRILNWDSSFDDVDVRHIHGDCDRVFPISSVEPDEMVAGGGHLISMTHGPQVNEFLRKHISQITAV